MKPRARCHCATAFADYGFHCSGFISMLAMYVTNLISLATDFCSSPVLFICRNCIIVVRDHFKQPRCGPLDLTTKLQPAMDTVDGQNPAPPNKPSWFQSGAGFSLAQSCEHPKKHQTIEPRKPTRFGTTIQGKLTALCTFSRSLKRSNS